MSDYGTFLDSKQASRTFAGRDADPSLVHPMLHDWQARVTAWAVKQGRAAIFADCGLGKTFMQLEWLRLLDVKRGLICAPLSVARQSVREAHRLGLTLRYVRSDRDLDSEGLYITNYEMVTGFDPAGFGAVVLDESSILKNVDGKTRRLLTDRFAVVPYRLCCTATPAPNDVTELTNHAEFLGVMPRVEMLAAYFVHDDEGWRLKGHARDPMYRWMASWAVAMRKPSDVGGDDAGYDLPSLTIHSVSVDVPVEAATDAAEPQLFATGIPAGITGRSRVRRATLAERVKRTAELVEGSEQAIVWTALNDEADQATEIIDGAVNVEGSWTPEAKASALEAFQDGDIRVLVTKPSIAGFGMNFQQCSRMVFCGLGDSYEAYYQAIRRCWRFGQRRPVDVFVVVSDLERVIVENVRRKEQEAAKTTAALVGYLSKELAA